MLLMEGIPFRRREVADQTSTSTLGYPDFRRTNFTRVLVLVSRGDCCC